MNKPEKYLMCWDANILCGWAMSQLWSYEDFDFSNVGFEDVPKTADDSEEGYMLEVDLHVHDELHDKFKECPP